MIRSKIVARYNNNRIVKGYSNNFFPNKIFFHLESTDGDSHRIEMDELKAVFFTRDFEGDKARQDDYSHEVRGAGRKMKVVFNDGEVVIGYSLAYSADRQGFFLTPADVNGNNERIFVLNDSSKSVEFL
jgi:Family of unknown function (DUF6982)